MDETKTFGQMRELLLAIKADWPPVQEIREWPAVMKTVEGADPAAALSEEAIAGARRLLDIIVVGPIGGVIPPRPPSGGPCHDLIKLVGWHGPQSQ